MNRHLRRRLWGYPVARLQLTAVDYDQYWRDKRKGDVGQLSDFQRHRAEVVASLIEASSSLLDLGCGNGAILNHLRSQKGIIGTGVDMSRLVLDHVDKLGFATLQADVTKPDSLKVLPVVDYIIALEVLEHLPDPERVLCDLDGKCRKAFVLSFPNTGYFVHRLRLLFGRFPAQWRLHPGEHLRFWTLADALWWVSAMDRELVALVPYEGVPFLNRVFPSWFAAGLVLCIAPKKP